MNSRFSSGLLAAVILSVSLSPHRAKADFHEDANDLTGAWTFHASRTVPAPVVDFVTLNNFSKDGTYMSSQQGDGICCPTTGPAYGVWTRTGSNQFALTFNLLLANADQSLFGTLKVNSAITLKSGKVSGQFDGRIVDPNENTITLVAGTFTGERISGP
jgi:hypothetical protein